MSDYFVVKTLWLSPVISTLGRLRQENPKLEMGGGGYIVRTCLNKSANQSIIKKKRESQLWLLFLFFEH